MKFRDTVDRADMPGETRHGLEKLRDAVECLDLAGEHLENPVAQRVAGDAGLLPELLNALAAETRMLRRRIADVKNAAERWIVETYAVRDCGTIFVYTGRDDRGRDQYRAAEIHRRGDKTEAIDPRDATEPRMGRPR